MSNEFVILLLSLLDIAFVFVAARMGWQRLFGVIALNLILVALFGAKLVTIFGYTTNVGNVFYACVFLATYFLLERINKKEALNTIWFGLVCLAFFIGLSQLAIHVGSVVSGDALDTSMRMVFSFSLRIVVASALAFAFAQYVNIVVYSWIKKMSIGNTLWVCALGASVVGQLIDSCLFFTIAFPDLSGTILVQSIVTGWFVKVGVIVIALPALYFDRYLLLKK